MISLVNLVGNNPKNIGHTADDIVEHTGGGSSAPQYQEYVDGDAFLLKIDPSLIGHGLTPSTPVSLIGAKNVGHFSGTDFFMQIRQDLEGNYIIAGSSSDQYGVLSFIYPSYSYTPSGDYNLKDADITDGKDRAFIVGANDVFESGTKDLWRRSFLSEDTRAASDGIMGAYTSGNGDDMMCVFGMDLTADGGYVIGGNNSGNHDDYTITKFAPLHQEMLEATSGGYSTFSAGSEIPPTHTVSGTETWPSSGAHIADGANIASWVIVPNGATLNISSGTYNFAASDQLWDFWMAPDNYAASGGLYGCGIVVQPGGTLNISAGVTLQGISIVGEHNVWDGIVVQGTYADPSTGTQGKVNIGGTISALATIKDARVGIFAGDSYRDYYHSPSVHISTSYSDMTGYHYGSHYDGTYNDGGGIVSAEYTNFTDCWFGLDFQNYIMDHNNSYVTNCTFNSDATGMGDICTYTDATGELLPSNTYIAEWQWRSLAVRLNSFSCDLSFPTTIRPVGVMAQAGSGVTVSNSGSGTGLGNTFSNLGYAVMATGNICESYPVQIAYNTFDNNSYGVNASGLTNSTVVKYNSFNVPGNGITFNPTGVTLAGCSGYDVSQNTFDKCSTCTTPTSWVNNYGVVINDGAPQYEQLNLNTFKNIWFASTAVGNNGSTTGLEFHCNDYVQNIYGIMRCSYLAGAPHPGACTINPQQGNCSSGSTALYSPANNQFYTCSSGSYLPSRIFASDNLVTQDVNYDYFATAPYDPGTAGTCVQTHNSLATGDPEILVKNTCFGTPPTSPDEACPPPPFIYYITGSGGIGGDLSELGALDVAIAANTDTDVAVTLQAQHDRDLAFAARYYALIDSFDSAAAILAGYNMYRAAFPYYIMAHDYTSAQTMIDNLPLVTPDDELYAWEAIKGINLYSTGRTWFDLDTVSADSMARVVQYNSGPGYMAGSITAQLGMAPVLWPIPIVDSARMDSLLQAVQDNTGDSSGMRIAHAGSGTTTTPINNINDPASLSFSVFPNPNFGNLKVTSSVNGNFDLYTIEGQLISSHTIATGSTDMQLPANLAAGFYMCVFRPGDGGETKTVRLVYQP